MTTATVRDAVMAGLNAFATTEPDFTMSRKMREAAADYIIAQTGIYSCTVPEGWKLVPIECTDEIAEAIAFQGHVCGGIAESIWHDALAASPTPLTEGAAA